MNYYRRYVGSYLKKTGSNSMIEDGAYTRLLDAYYATEKPLNPKKVNEIAKAMTSAERKAVATVVEAFFYLGPDGLLHNEKADEELSIAAPMIERMQAASRENGKKGGRPRKPVDNKPSGNPEETRNITQKVTQSEPDRNHPLSVSHQPEPNPSDIRFPGVGDIPASPPKASGAEPPEVKPDALARIVAECVRAKVEDATPENAVVQRWSTTATPTQVTKALEEARRPGSKPYPAELRVGYVDAILVKVVKADADSRTATEARLKRTQDIIAEGIESKAHAVPKPDDFPKVKRAAA